MWMLDKIAKGALKNWIAILTCLIVLLIAALLTLAILRIRQDAGAQASLKASYLSAALAEDAEGLLDTIAVASEFVKRRVEAEGNAAPLNEFKQQIANYIPQLVNISVTGPDGRLLATSGDVASIPADLSQFEFFIATRDSTSSGFRVGKPVRGLLSQQVTIPYTERLENKDGAFAGVLLFSTDPEHAAALFHRVDLGNSGSLMIVGPDGTIFGGYTLPRGLDPSFIGTPVSDKEVIARLQGAPSGSFIAANLVDGIERIYSWRRLNDFPGIALVGLGKAESLAGANRQAILLSGLGVLSIGVLLALTAMLVREISRRTKEALDLAERNVELAAARLDIAERERHAEQVNLLLSEVNHRAKNMLAVVQAIARQTVSANPDDFIERFGERIQALAASQELLVENEWRGVDLNELARSQLDHFKDMIGARIDLCGPPLLISATAAQPLGMALHELATNAGKYGALSNDTGRVELHWSLGFGEGGAETFVISWRERGGPTVTAPARSGFGSTVLCRVMKESLDAQVELDFEPTGLVWRLQCAAGRIMAGSRSA